MTDEVRECLAEMGVTEEVFATIRAASNHTDGTRLLEEAKEVCRKGFRAIASSYHPDHNQHLPAEEIKLKEERFKGLRSVHDSFLKSRYRGPARSRTQLGADNFDPLGFHGRRREEMEDDLRFWGNPVAREAIRRQRDADRARLIKMAHEIMLDKK
jgi:DnaJ-class molecular chaperone